MVLEEYVSRLSFINLGSCMFILYALLLSMKFRFYELSFYYHFLYIIQLFVNIFIQKVGFCKYNTRGTLA